MPTYVVNSGKHTLWEGDKKSGEHFDVVPGDEFTIKKLPPALLPYMTRVTSEAATTKRKTRKASTTDVDETNDEGTSTTE